MVRKAINRTETLVCGEVYHVYNKAVGSELLFKTDEDYEHFLKKIERFILPVANIYAYCLIPNYFHLMLRIKEPNDIPGLQRIGEDEYSNFLYKYSATFLIATQNHLTNCTIEPGDCFSNRLKGLWLKIILFCL